MSRAAAFVPFFLATLLTAQEATPAGPLSPPSAPVSAGAAPVIPVAPPMPGQLQATPALPPPTPGSLAPVSPGQAPATTPPPDFTAAPKVSVPKSKSGSSTSTTGQFIVHGDDLTLRSALSSKCEDISAELRTLLHDKQSWVLPVVVLLNSGDAARKAEKPVSTVISQLTHGGFHLQVNVNMRPDLKPSELRKEIIRALLAERILRDQKEITAKRNLLLPDWLFLGILEALDYRQRTRPSTLFAAIFKSGKIFGIEEIIEAAASDIDDGLSKTIYQTSCCALVLALLDQPDSGLRMGKFLNALASDPRSERELLNQWFPNFATSEASLNKWWALQLATLASPSMAEPLSPQDTLAALEEALIFRYQAKPSELPQSSRRVIAAAKPAPALVRPSAPVSKPAPEETPPAEEGPETEVKEKRGFIRRLNPFSRGQSSDEEIAAAIAEAAREEAESSMSEAEVPPVGADLPPESSSPPAAAATGRKPLLNRWFAGDEKTEAKTKEEDKSKPEKKAAPKVKTEKADESPEPEKKPSNLNPMNWFKGGKKDPKDAENPAPDEEKTKGDKDKQAALSPEPETISARLRADLPILAFVYQEVAVEAEEPKVEKRRFFGLLGKKKPENDPAEPEAPKRLEDKPKADKKDPPPEPKKTKDDEKPEEPMTEAEEPQSEADKAKRQPLRLRLFGSDKKDDESKDKEKAEEEMPADAPEAPAAEEAPPARPKPEPAPKTQAPKDETPIAATIPIEDYAAILKRPDLNQIIRRNANALAVLQNRGSVLFRPVVNDYITALEDILKGRTKGLDERLRTLRARTQQALEKSNAVRDLLDLHEANDSPAMSGLFEDYLKLPQTIQNELPPRTDPISKYLDALEKEFSKE